MRAILKTAGYLLVVIILGAIGARLLREYREPHADVVIYGATPAGITAAVSASRQGKSAILVAPASHIGGMVSSGLSYSDVGNRRVVGGLAHEFFERIGNRYKLPIAYVPEPHVARDVFVEWLNQENVRVIPNEPLDRVEREGTSIIALRTINDLRIRGSVFIDASYEGDLLAAADVEYAIGREARSKYHEHFAGVREKNTLHQFSPAVAARDREGRLLPGIHGTSVPPTGSGDRKVPSYNFRLCMTERADNKVAIEAPAGYSPSRYALLARYLDARPELKLDSLLRMMKTKNDKFDVNSKGPFSLSLIGENWDYPEASYEERQKIFDNHVNYTQGLLFFLSHNADVPEHVRRQLARFGLCKDEFVETNNWPPELYVREARRMIGRYVMREKDVRQSVTKPDSIGMGSYRAESHHVQRLANDDGDVFNEGYFTVTAKPYEIAYRSITPKPQQATNLLVPVALSASHVAYSSIRMEPVYMILGQAAGTAAALAIDANSTVQNISVEKLQQKLREGKQILSWADRHREAP
ncbi:MAG: FAD-dependent oxidoreductase [Bdellovibrionales bacterium]|nr:FAD-dependent oxidoreductase [Bdellovibrionales bacterium]